MSAALSSRLGNWIDADVALHRSLAAAVGRLIDRGELPAGTRLPTERALAAELSISRTTVVAAYDLLKAQGRVESRQGSGTWVQRRPAASIGDTDHLPAMLRLGRLQSGPGDRGAIDLATGALGPARVVRDELAALVADGAALDGVLSERGYQPAGLAVLRESIAERLTADGVATSRRDIVVTTGAQQALSLLAAALLRPGDSVAVEAPTHPGALDVWRAAGARLSPIPLGRDGLDPEGARTVLERDRPKLLYLTPTFHNPTGSVVPRGSREEIARIAARTGTLIVEDDALRTLDFGRARVPPPIAAIAPTQTVLVGSMSKLYWAGLRVGWVRAPAELRNRIATMKTTVDLGTPVLEQVLAARLLRLGEDATEDQRRLLRANLEALCDALATAVPDWSFVRPDGGFSLWVRLPALSATAFASAALQHGVTVGPGPAFSHDLLDFDDHLQLAFTQPADVLRVAVDRLRVAYETARR